MKQATIDELARGATWTVERIIAADPGDGPAERESKFGTRSPCGSSTP
ncbi:hypothetical protein AFCDBAGC_0077 [Methylobacterium cerastii]|uniref:Uncharacterized protein n=1 Tax=Methylobacterium cerastii TaxID=932741 RepID=A0ABQ4QAX1_9HYPH|nr:hypothetical protein [Methylobacterium cerastii]GJD42242.1 hypothetical protein AFCDBAGC_0077 [Methylobacterium cerastii]